VSEKRPVGSLRRDKDVSHKCTAVREPIVDVSSLCSGSSRLDGRRIVKSDNRCTTFCCSTANNTRSSRRHLRFLRRFFNTRSYFSYCPFVERQRHHESIRLDFTFSSTNGLLFTSSIHFHPFERSFLNPRFYSRRPSSCTRTNTFSSSTSRSLQRQRSQDHSDPYPRFEQS